ncbi:ribonuclease HI [Desulfoluna sp.]|uniref:ribonuclease HI n=1 Tax=Desulfoluna sp. TaxID=2045199 RepID=UPI00262E4892|nr:ribonuclease HI [Desulfoluna sp.]
MASSKFYAVAIGRVPGIYTNWPDAQSQVSGFEGAKYKSFTTREEAETWRKNPTYNQVVRKRCKVKEAPTTKPAPRPKPDGKLLQIFSDGGAIGNPGPGGYGVVIVDGKERTELQGGYGYTTNNRMELMGCIKALEHIGPTKRPLVVTTDSSYVVNGISKGWAEGWRKKGWIKSDGKPAVNTDLWAKLLDLCATLSVRFQWVKGHAGHPENERCDTLANTTARSGKNLDLDVGYVRSL